MANKIALLLAALAAIGLSCCLVGDAHPMAQNPDPDATVVETLPNGTVKEQIKIQNAALSVLPAVNTNEVEVFQPADHEQEKKVVDAIVKELQTNFAAKYQEQLKEKLPSGDYPVRGFSASNGIELNGKITGLEHIRLSKAFEASANKSDGLTAYNVKAEMEIPELIFEFNLVKYFPFDVFKILPVRGVGRANMTAFLPLETKTTPNAQTTTTGCISAVDAVARADNVQVDVTFTNALGRGLQWIRNNLNLDLADSVLSNFAKTIVDVVMSILQLIICGAIEAATKAVLVG